MKFVALNSRGGNYLVVASNIAWLRAAENGQTTVGIVGDDAPPADAAALLAFGLENAISALDDASGEPESVDG